MGFKTRIARKKARACLRVALTVAFLVDLNGFIEFLKVLPEQESGLVFENPPLKIPVAHAEAGKNATATPFAGESGTETPSKPLQGNFSAYTASEDETDDDPRRMASGKLVYQGAVACPDALVIENGKRVFGKKIEVKGLGVFTCEDRMNERYRDKAHFDIFMETKDEAFAFGRRNLEYKILD